MEKIPNMHSVSQAARLKRCSRQTIYTAIRERIFPAITVGTARIVMDSPAFRAWSPVEYRQENGRANRKKAE